MYEQFKAKAESVSAEVHRFGTRREAADFVVRFLLQEKVCDAPGRRAVRAECGLLNGLDLSLPDGVAGPGFQVTRELAAEARIGISQMDWALADTGTLVQNSTAVDQRLVSSLPAIHIALAATDRILPDMPALLARLSPQDCAYIAMITGPSRTADIERVLTIGVHGPERLVIVFVDESGGEN